MGNLLSRQTRKLGVLTSVSDQDRDDKSVNTDNTSHNNGNNTLHDQIGTEDTHGGETDTRLGSAVGSSKAYDFERKRIEYRQKRKGGTVQGSVTKCQ